MTDVDNLLAGAITAARHRANVDVDDGAATRLRLRESFASGGLRRRRRIMTIIAAVLAMLFGSTAFALVSHWRAPEAAVATPVIEAPAISEPPLVERRVTVARKVPAPPQLRAEIQPRVEPNAPVKQLEAPAPAPAVELPAPPISGELAAYRVAHEAHFRGGDAAAALAAWDAYLAKFPDGQLAPEARYDRALVLIKLKRFAEAKQALAPFATASGGSYRQREAAKLLEALGRDVPH